MAHPTKVTNIKFLLSASAAEIYPSFGPYTFPPLPEVGGTGAPPPTPPLPPPSMLVGAVVKGVVLVDVTVLLPAVIVEFPVVPFPALAVATGAAVMV